MELIVVFAIIGILAAILAPGWIAWLNNARFKEAEEFAVASLRQAKSQAIDINQQVSVVFTLDSTAANTVTIGGGAANPFASGIEIKRGTNCDVSNGTITITFNPNGTSSTGQICVFDGATQKYRVGVNTASTGRIVSTKY